MRIAACIAAILIAVSASAEGIKVGMVKTSAGGAIFVAQEKGLFARAGCPAELVFFDSAQPVAVAAVSGAIDFGVTGLTGGFYSLAGQGALKIIAGSNQEAPGFQYLGHVVSNHAYEGGLKGFRDLPGHSFAMTQMGTTLVYALALVADKYGFDFKSLRMVALQSNANVSSAIAGGQADAAVLPVTPAIALVSRGDAKLLGWVGDETPGIQANVAFAAAKTAAERRDTVDCFLRAYKDGTRAFHDAFTGAHESRADGPAAAETVAILAKYTGERPDTVKLAIPYVDAESRLNIADLKRQIAWYKAQGFLKGEADGEAMIDRRTVVPLPPP
ncbi:MAG TPA: ABC transporter substrate-binding protein [Stellaceae bacterium]|nr:ABC transporter substrate-binding protein [Stellaceae bacterium]